MTTLPNFLEGYTVNARHPLRKVPLDNWVMLHGWMTENTHWLKTADYARLMVIELERTKPRLQILLRLKGKFEVARRADEREMLVKSV